MHSPTGYSTTAGLCGRHIQITQPILLVEDSESVAALFRKSLEIRWQCEVHHAKTYAEAKQYLVRHRRDYHMAICDLNLPDAPDGQIIDLVNAAKLKSIAVTGKFGDEMKQSMAKKRVVDYVLKQSTNSIEYVVEQVGRLFHNKSLHVLVVDDSPVARELTTAVLETQNLNVHQAHDGQHALEVLDYTAGIQLVVTDYNMPRMDGIELTVELRKKLEDTTLAIIGVSANGRSDLGVQFIKNGANDFLVKPFAHEELVCRVNQNLDMLEHVGLIHNMATHDEMTQLYNRRHFFQQAGHMLLKSVRARQQSAVVMIDVDRFKQINDTLGHYVGDEVIIAVAKLLQDLFADSLCARLGGDEFVILMSNVDGTQTASRLEEFRATLAGTEIHVNGHTLRVTPSIGYCVGKETNITAMLKAADERLYESKAAGRNCVHGTAELASAVAG